VDQLNLEALGSPTREIRKVFEENIANYRPVLWRYCLKLTGSPWDAEDLAQETILKAFALVPFYYQEIVPKAYLFRMATNTWIDQCRRARLPLDSFEEDMYKLSDHQVIDPLEIRTSIEHLITNLPPRQRVVVLLSDVFDFTAREVADMISTTEGAVKAILHRARKTLMSSNIDEDMSPNQATTPLERQHHAIVDAYIEAFNRRDVDAIAALLDEGALVDIVGVTHECGRETIRKYSLEHTAQSTDYLRAEASMLWGEPVVLVYTRPEQKPEGLNWVIRIATNMESITSTREYYFCPDLLTLAGEELGLPIYTNGYFWT
jgi:RNA polymerase sigma factor (sigma-70 family)